MTAAESRYGSSWLPYRSPGTSPQMSSELMKTMRRSPLACIASTLCSACCFIAPARFA